MIVRKYVIPVLAVAGVAFAIYTVRSQNKPTIPAQAVAQPASSPYEGQVAGSGIVESSSENIAIGASLPGVVTKMFVSVGDRLKAGDPLFQIDDRNYQAELLVRKAALRQAEQNLAKLAAQPRPEDIPPAEARVAEQRAFLEDSRSQLALMDSVPDKRAISQDDWNRRRFAVNMAQARLVQAEADLAELKAGAWKPDLEIAQAQIESARAQLRSTEIEIDRLTVRAPVDGTVLQRNIRPGEFAQAGPLTTPLILFGSTDVLHIRVDVDENDAWRIRPDSKARASVRGNKDLQTDLTFVRIEPYVVPKKSLTGDSSERVDTRVLQVRYAFPNGRLPVYVGQQMDVFIDAPSRSAAAASAKEASK